MAGVLLLLLKFFLDLVGSGEDRWKLESEVGSRRGTKLTNPRAFSPWTTQVSGSLLRHPLSQSTTSNTETANRSKHERTQATSTNLSASAPLFDPNPSPLRNPPDGLHDPQPPPHHPAHALQRQDDHNDRPSPSPHPPLTPHHRKPRPLSRSPHVDLPLPAPRPLVSPPQHARDPLRSYDP